MANRTGQGIIGFPWHPQQFPCVKWLGLLQKLLPTWTAQHSASVKRATPSPVRWVCLISISPIGEAVAWSFERASLCCKVGAIADVPQLHLIPSHELNVMTHVQGELFKADGEVVSSGRPAGAPHRYELAAYPMPVLRPPAVVLSSSGDETEALKQRLAEAVQLEQTLCRQVHIWLELGLNWLHAGCPGCDATCERAVRRQRKWRNVCEC